MLFLGFIGFRVFFMNIQTFNPTKKRVLQRQVLPEYSRRFGVSTQHEKPPVAVFDFDGTLFQGRAPRHALIRWCKSLPCECVIVTARFSTYRAQTIRQLEKQGIAFKGLFMMRAISYADQELAIQRYKAKCRAHISEQYEIVLSVGDMWHDLHTKPDHAETLDDQAYYIGPGFIKLPKEQV